MKGSCFKKQRVKSIEDATVRLPTKMHEDDAKIKSLSAKAVVEIYSINSYHISANQQMFVPRQTVFRLYISSCSSNT